MPYKLSQDGKCVQGEDGKPVPGGCHETHEEAVAHMRALYANVPDAKKENSGFTVFKQADGQYRWVSVSSSPFEDRDGEIVKQAALEKAVARMDTTGQYGTLDFWHIPGADIGPCDISLVDGKLLYESGTFFEPWMAQIPQPGDGTSLMFKSAQRGEYDNINIIKRAVLPGYAASNLLTDFAVVTKESEDMTTVKEKWDELRKRLSPEDQPKLDAFREKAEARVKAAEDAGLVSKEAEVAAPPVPPVGQGAPAPEPPAPEPVPVEKQAAEAEPDADDMPHSRAEMEQMIRGVVEKCMDERMGGMKKEVSDLAAAQAEAVTQKATADASTAAILQEIKKQVKDTAAVVKELSGEQPRGVRRGYRASEENTVNKETADLLKQVGDPKPDPFYAALLKNLGANQAGNMNGQVPGG